jgi:hypothetical protein
MSLTQIAVLLAGVWLILQGAGAALSSTVTLIFGIAIVVLVLLDWSPVVGVVGPRRRTAPPA